jgi:CheY-like chemotaxis protein
MVHGIAEQSGGRFVLRSVAGKGTAAEIWLPVASRRPQADEPAAPAAAKTAEPARLTILAVDDDALMLLNRVAMLEDLGHPPLSASSAAEALAIARENENIDLVITDHIMPQMTGLRMLEELQRLRPSTAAILATGYAELDQQDLHIPRLTKPFTQAELAALIAGVARTGRRAARVLQFRPGNGNGNAG